MNFQELADNEKIYEFYGVCNNEFKINSIVWEAIEDPDDGYRSFMDSIEVVDSNGIFFDFPLATVKIITDHDSYHKCYKLIDTVDGHVWLKIGTSDYNDYYPYFVFDYEPKNSL